MFSLWQWLDETREEVTIKRKGDAGYDQTAGLDSCLVDQDLEYDEDEWMFREGQRQAQVSDVDVEVAEVAVAAVAVAAVAVAAVAVAAAAVLLLTH